MSFTGYQNFMWMVSFFFCFFFHISPRGKKGYLEKGVLKLFALQFLDFKSIGLYSKFLSPETKLAIALFSIVFVHCRN